MRLSRYLPRVYFGVFASFLDEKGSTLAPDRFIPVAAGANERFTAPYIKGYQFQKSPDFSIDAPLQLDNFIGAQLIYKADPSAVHAPSRSSATRLSGRRLPQGEQGISTSHGRLLIVDGKVQVQP